MFAKTFITPEDAQRLTQDLILLNQKNAALEDRIHFLQENNSNLYEENLRLNRQISNNYDAWDEVQDEMDALRFEAEAFKALNARKSDEDEVVVEEVKAPRFPRLKKALFGAFVTAPYVAAGAWALSPYLTSYLG